MFVSIVENQSGNQELLRRLAPNETLDLEVHCKKWAEQMDVTIAKPNGNIPCGCADYYAEIRHTKAATGSCWMNYNFYLESEE